MKAVKEGLLGRLPKSGLKPEVFFHPDHKNGAKDAQKREEEYILKMSGVMSANINPLETNHYGF